MVSILRRTVSRRTLVRQAVLGLGLVGLLGLSGLGTGGEALAGEPVQLALKFREGQQLRYSYSETLTYAPPIKFVGVTGYELSVKVDYRIAVNRVTAEQGASVKLTFERIAVFKDGRQICDLSVFPKDVGGISGSIKPNGETTWYKNVYLTVNKAGRLEFRVGSGGGVIATGTLSVAGSEKNSLEANLDEGEGVIQLGVPPYRTLETPDHGKLAEFKVDLTPRKIFEFLLLPTLPLDEGQTFSTSVKYLGQEKLLYKGQSDEGGHQGNAVSVDITPWLETSTELVGLQPAVTGNVGYMIDTMGKLVYAKGKLRTEIVIPDVGVQTGESRIELMIRK